MIRNLPAKTPPPKGAWSPTGAAFHPDSHFCTHCKRELPPGAKLWAKKLLVLCVTCMPIVRPTYRN